MDFRSLLLCNLRILSNDLLSLLCLLPLCSAITLFDYFSCHLTVIAVAIKERGADFHCKYRFVRVTILN
uniref:Putative secreted protein n=1 Tax=Panstrongylus lignarius TaxID=156445 RepID=A0A224XY75_9HEMI